MADEANELKGEWQAVEVEMNGKKASKDDATVKAVRFVFEGTDMTMPDPTGRGKDRKKTFRLDPAKLPKEIDMTSLDGQEKNATLPCIYKLDGDRPTLRMPYASQAPAIRPKEFKAGANDGIMLLTLGRVKAKK